jgi:beta-lactamase regulating signal transducer with metallopeptidase domain
VETLLHAGLSNALSATFLALLVACLGRALARRPALLHCLWLLVLVKLVMPPLYEVPIPWLASLGAGGTEQPVSCLVPIEITSDLQRLDAAVPDVQLPADGSAQAYAVELRPEANIGPAQSGPGLARATFFDGLALDWTRLLATIWLAGSAATLVLTCYRIVRFQLLLRLALPASEEVQDWVDELARGVGLARTPGVWLVAAKLSPMLWVLGRRPRLIIPIDLWKGLDHQERATLIVHELAHLKRGDHRVRFFELALTVIYWWHPVLWWVRRALRNVEEQCCDAWVIWAFPHAAKCYAETLLETLDFLNQADHSEPLLASGFGKVQHLRKRLTMIMCGTTPRLVSFWGTLGSLALATVLLPVSASWAQKPAQDQNVEVVLQVDDEPVVVTEDVTKKGGPGSGENVRLIVKAIDGKTISDEPVAEVREIHSSRPQIVLRELTGVLDDSNSNVNLIIKSDDAPDVVVSGSLDEAMSKLKKQLEALGKKSPLSDADKKRQRSLERAAAELKKVAQQLKQIESADDKKSGVTITKKPEIITSRVVVRNLKDLADLKLSDEQKAQIREARERVAKLTKEFAVKRKELAEARGTLSKLQGRLAPNVLTYDIKGPDGPIKFEVKDDAKIGVGVGIGVGSSAKKPSAASDKLNFLVKTIEKERSSGSDRERIEVLEKKLKELLDEVARLKGGDKK